jgi:hypothetical protein
LLSGDSEQFGRGTDRHNVTGSLNRMPHCSRHLVSHLFVDGGRNKSMIQPFPYVNARFDCSHIERWQSPRRKQHAEKHESFGVGQGVWHCWMPAYSRLATKE